MAVVVLGLASSLSWGAADFGGGLTSRRGPLLGVLVTAQLVGLMLAVALAWSRGEPAMTGLDVGWSVLCGILGAIGLAGLYSGLAIGRMSVVAPVTGLVATCVPVVGAILLEGLPGTLVLAGIGLAIVAILLVSIVAETDPGRPSGLAQALAAGVGLGLFSLALSRVGDGLVFSPLVVVRGVEAVLFALAIVTLRRPWRVGRSLWPAVLGIGVLDMFGNAFYLAAAQSGALAVAVVMSALYPVVTAILAAVVLRERITPGHATGIAAAVLAIVLIVGGSA
jgi:drug/metabolite transporter (DMT)-like permease